MTFLRGYWEAHGRRKGKDAYGLNPNARCQCRFKTYQCKNQHVKGERFCWYCLDVCAEQLANMTHNQDTL